MMYNVLIAEDSKPILRNIKQLIERSELPLNVVHTAYNGEEALEYIKTHAIDILLTDIRMPKLDGLSLIEEAKSYLPELKVVLISSYSDFEYTRKAINLQVFDYLLKPVEQQQLDDVMSRVLRKLDELRKARQAMLGDIVAEDWVLEPHNRQDFFDQPKLMMLLCSQPFTSQRNWRHELIRPLLSNCCEPYPSWLLPLKQNNKLLLLSSVALRDKVTTGTAWLKDIQEQLRRQDINISAVCHLEPVEPDRIYATYQSLEATLDQELTLFSPILLEYEQSHIPTYSRAVNDTLRVLQEYIVHRQKEPFSLKLAEHLKHMKLTVALWSELVQLVAFLEGAFNEAWQESAPDEYNADPTPLLKKLNLEDYDSFCVQFIAWCEDQFQRLQSYNRKSSEELFELMDQHIQRHVYSQLSIGELALKFHVSPSYVSRIIKRFTGQTFVQYYMKLKIDESCRLMQSKPSLLIRELSDALAFSDQHYFSRVFKEYTGYTPTEYKNQWHLHS